MLFQESVIAFLHDILIVVSRCRDLILTLGLSMTPGYFHWKQNGKEGLFTWHWDKSQYRMKFILHSHGTIKNTDSAQDVLICLVSAPLIPDYVLYMVWKV